MRKIPSPGTHNLHFSDKSPFRFENRFSPLTRANRVRQERPKIKLILAPPPSIPEILSAELGCYQGESRIRDFQREKVNSSAVPGMENSFIHNVSIKLTINSFLPFVSFRGVSVPTPQRSHAIDGALVPSFCASHTA